MFKGIFFSLWIACVMAASKKGAAEEDGLKMDSLIPVIAQPTFPTAAAQCAPIVLGANKWIQVESQEDQYGNGNRRQRFTFTVMDTPVTQNNIFVEVNRKRIAVGRPPINQAFLTHLASYFQDSPVTSVRLEEVLTQNGQVVHSLMDPARVIEGKLVDEHGKSLKLELEFYPARSLPTFILTLTKPKGFEYEITLPELGKAISKFTRVVLSEAKLASIEKALSQSDDESRLGIYFPTDPITGHPQSTVNLRWIIGEGEGNIELWGSDDFAWGHFKDSGNHKKTDGFITDDEKNFLDVEFIVHLRSNPWMFKMNIARNSEGEVKDAVSKLQEIVLKLASQKVRPEVFKAILEKVRQEPIGQVNKFTLTESDLEGQQLRLI